MIYHEVYDRVKDPKGYMLEMVRTFTEERLKNKKLAKETKIQYYDDMQNAQKIVINSFYGFLGAEGLLFNSPKNAALVTEKGRDILQMATRWATGHELIKVLRKGKDDDYEWIVGPKIDEGKGFSLVNADTDSITITLDGKELEEGQRKDIVNEINSLYPERIRFEDDGYYKSIVVIKAKNYALKSFDGKIKTKGSAFKDAKKEISLKEMQKRILEVLLA
jgi:DNA polymerase elongation subunit (family B)